MTRSISAIMGIALLSVAALVAESQTSPAEQPATTTAPAQPISQSLGLLVYPAKGQSSSQQCVDEQECYNWAKTQTGIDPAAPPPDTTAASEESKPKGGQRVRSAARGAAAGAVIGEVANNDADEGAKVGAAAGVIAGGRKSREDKRAHEQHSKDVAQAAQTEQQTTFKKAVGTCLQGRGYTTG